MESRLAFQGTMNLLTLKTMIVERLTIISLPSILQFRGYSLDISKYFHHFHVKFIGHGNIHLVILPLYVEVVTQAIFHKLNGAALQFL